LTKWYLFSLLALPSVQTSTIKLPSGAYIDGIVLAVEREDGSGQSFNVCVRYTDGSVHVHHVRTID